MVCHETFRGCRQSSNHIIKSFYPEDVHGYLHRKIGSAPTLWSSWLIAAHPEVLKARISKISPENIWLSRARHQGGIDRLCPSYKTDCLGQARQEIIGYSAGCQELPTKAIWGTLSGLERAGVARAPEGGFQLRSFVNTCITKLS